MRQDSARERAHLASVDGLPGSSDRGVGAGAETEEEAEDFLRRLDHVLPSPPRPLRVALAVLCLGQLVLVTPWLVDTDPFDLLGASATHVVRDGSLGLVIAIAGLLAAWRPRWAVPIFLISSVALVAQTISGIVDSTGQGAANEYVHLPAVIITCLIGVCGVRLPDLGPRR